MSEQVLGMCDKRQYEHNGPHQKFGENGQKFPPFPCVNWHPIVVTSLSSGTDVGGEPQTVICTDTNHMGGAVVYPCCSGWSDGTAKIVLAVDAEVVKRPPIHTVPTAQGSIMAYCSVADVGEYADLLERENQSLRERAISMRDSAESNAAAHVKAVQGYEERLKVVSATYGDLVRVSPIVSTRIEPHIWDNMNPSEQRDWALAQLESEIERMKAGGAKS